MEKRKNSTYNRDLVLEYIYEYGWSETKLMLNIDEEQINHILSGKTKNWKDPNLNKNITITELNLEVNKFITDNYEKLYSKYVKDKTNTRLYQDDEDIFHQSLIQLSNIWSYITEEFLLERFDNIYKMNKWEYKKKNSQMRIKEKSMKQEFENIDIEDEEYIENKLPKIYNKLFEKYGLNK